jgi:hypothetical protein
MEEADLRANNLIELGSYYINNRKSDQKMHVYLGSDLQAESLPGDLEEDIQSYWVSEDEIEDLIKKGEIKITVIATGFNPQKKSDTSDKVFGRGIVREEIDEEVEQQPVRRNSVETPQMPDKVLEEISDDDWANVPAFLRRKK